METIICNPRNNIFKMRNTFLFFLIFVITLSCNQRVDKDSTNHATTRKNYDSYANTVSPDGKIESTILLHSRMGIRIEMNLNKDELNLWISPQAGKSVDNRYRNFSNRDDHTSIFDRISFPELGKKKFIRCDYDPFHSVLYFEGQTMHIASLIDNPSVLIWFDKQEVVDIKSDKQDSLLVQSPTLFGTHHPDRGLVLDFFAALGGKDAVFQHQPEVEINRSIYARSMMMPGQFMAISGELTSENIKGRVEKLSSTNLTTLLDRNENKIKEETQPGTVVLKNLPDLQKLYNINQRHLLSVQDASGALHAALKYVYYLIWATDGTVTSSSMMQTGNSKFLKLWCEYLLANPTVQSAPPKGRFYGQLVNRKITKREEFGSLCAVWPAFMYWGLTGDDRFVSGENRQLLIDVVDWVDRNNYDSNLNAIGTYYIGGGSEDPFLGSNDYGYDAAVGSFLNGKPYTPSYDGHPILRAYEFNMNLNQYNMYLMLSEVTEGAQSQAYIEKAKTIEKFLNRLDSLDASAIYLLKDKGLVTVKRKPGETENGLFAIQDIAPASFMPNFHKYFMNRMHSFKPYTTESIKNQYACNVYGRLAGLDIEFVKESDIVASLSASAVYNVKPSEFIPMPYTMVEVFGAETGTYHDIRPQAFSTGPFQAAITNLAIRTMPFGIALRNSNVIKELDDFEYLKSNLDLAFTGSGEIAKISLNGKELKNTLQIPDADLLPGKNKVEVLLDNEKNNSTQLVYSTVRLLKVVEEGNEINYKIKGYSQNVLIFKNAKENPVIKDQSGNALNASYNRDGIYLFVEFFGKGDYTIDIVK